MSPQSLCYACLTGDEALVRKLISYGGDVNAACADGKTPVLAAVEGRHTHILKLLIASGAELKRATIKAYDGSDDILKLAFDGENDELLEIVIDHVDDMKRGCHQHYLMPIQRAAAICNV